MDSSHRYCLLGAAISILIGSSVWAASLAETIPADSAFAKANPAWQRQVLSTMHDTSKTGESLVPENKVLAGPAFEVPGKFALAPMRVSIYAKSAGALGDYKVTQRVGGQAKLLGMWANVSAGTNVTKVGFEVTDSEGENFIYTADADWTGWKWIEVDLASDKLTPVAKAGAKDAKNGKIDYPLGAAHVVWSAKDAGLSTILIDELAAVSDMGTQAPARTLAVGDLGQMTLEPGGKLKAQVCLSNLSDKDISTQMEFVIQEDPACYSKPAPLPKYGYNVATGTHSWFELAGKIYDIKDSLTDGKPTTDFGGPMDKNGWEEAFAYIDLGKTVRVVHMGRMGGNASRIYKVDFASSLDGKEYKPVEGMKTVDFFQKWEPQEIDVPQPFEARFIRLRIHNNGQKMTVYALPSEFFVYDGEKADTWDFPDAGTKMLEGKQTQVIPAKSSELVQIGDGRALNPGSYHIAVRTKTGDVTQMNYGRILVMPPTVEKVTRDLRFGMNGIEYPSLARRQSYSWVRFENLKWPMVSRDPGAYFFDGRYGQKYDEIFRAYHETGLSIMPYLFLTPKYLVPQGAKGEGVTYPPTDMSKYGEFAFQVVARYGSKKHPAEALLTNDRVSGLGYIDTFELWNEADLNDPNWGSWRGKFEDFYIMYRYGAEAVKKADPDARVANGGWSGMDVRLMETMRNYKYPDGKCPLDFTDVLSVHYYSFQDPPELAKYNENNNRSGAPLHGLTFEEELHALVAWRDKYKPSMPIYMSETGYDTGGPKAVDERTQACWLVRDVMVMLAAGIDKVQVFREKGSGFNLFAASGVVRDDQSLKPSWFTYSALIRQLGAVTERPARMIFKDGNIRAYLWKNGEKRVLTAWAIRGSASMELPLGHCTVTDAFGLSKSVDAGQSIALTEFPLYLTDFDAPVAKALEDQARQSAQAEQAQIERQSKLQAYLFQFGSKGRGATMMLGTQRTFNDVMAADLYDQTKGYGFETQGLQDRDERWLRPPFSVRVGQGARLTFKAKPGDYELTVFARPQGSGQVIVKGLDGGDQTLKVAEGGPAVKATVKVGANPVTLETGFAGELVWATMIEIDAQK